MFSASFTSSGDLLIGSQGNILLCSLGKDSVSVKTVIEGFNNSAINAIHKTEDRSRFLIGTEDNGLFLLKISDKGKFANPFQ